MPRTHLTYSEYINDKAIVEALRLPRQGGDWPTPPVDWQPGDDWPEDFVHHEVLFIRTHQAFEVWFAQIIHDLHAVIAEADAYWTSRGGRLERLDFEAPTAASREMAPLDPKAFPRVARTLREAGEKYLGDANALLGGSREFHAPGRLHGTAGIRVPQTAAEHEELERLLTSWTARLECARLAMRATIPFFDVLATLTAAEFLLFRDRLQPASGFGSIQFRELELMLGLRELHRPKIQPDNGSSEALPGEPPLPEGMLRPTEATPQSQFAQSFYFAQPGWGWARVAKRFREHSLRDVVYGLLNAVTEWAAVSDSGVADLSPGRLDEFVDLNVRAGIRDFFRGSTKPLPLQGVDADNFRNAIADVDGAMAQRETLAAAVLEMDLHRTPLTTFLDACLRMDGAVLEWRDRHIRFVEGQIGMRRGTGGGGIRYLRETVTPRKLPYYTHGFPALWLARTFVQQRES